MVRILESKTTETVGKYWYSLSCDEGDTKPTGEFPADSGKTIADGSRLFENGTEIRYELQNGSWVAVGQVDVPAPVLEDKTVTPTTSQQVVTADEGYDSLSSVTVEAVTSAIDANITAENIKDGVSILGVAGTLKGVEFSASPAAFTLVSNITNLDVDVPNGVTSIGNNAFYECTGLKSINIPNGVTSIASSAFSGCTGLTNIDIPGSVTTIQNNTFSNCTGLLNAKIESGTTIINNSAFSGCSNLKTVELPDSITYIYNNAFSSCPNLETITIHQAEDSLSGAPWGATNATVIWDGE